MAVSSVIGTKRDGEIRIKDSGAAHTFTVVLDIGDFSFEEPKDDRVVLRDRGAICGLRAGDQAVGTISFSAHFTEFTNSTAETLYDWIYRRGTAAAYVGTGGAGYEQFLVDITYVCDKTTLGDAVSATANFSKVLLFASFQEGDSDAITITGEVYGAYTYTGIS